MFAIFSFWLGFAKGFAGTLLQVTIYFVALMLTLVISPWLAEIISNTFPVGKLFALLFGTIGVFILICYIFYFLTKRLDASLKRRQRTTQSKLLGGIVMTITGILIFGLMLGAIHQFNLIKTASKESSLTYKFLKPIPEKASAFVETFKPLFRKYWESMEETVKEN